MVIFCDLSKAFDTINHERLLNKLHCIGIRGKAHELLRSYLSNRRQVFKYDDSFSEAVEVKYGVPQGSVLGPLLFNIFMNEIFAFADVTVIVVTDKNLENLYRLGSSEFSQVWHWMRINGLVLNMNKTKHMLFGKNSKKHSIDLQIHSSRCSLPDCNCICIDRTHSYKYLGLTIDENLKFKQHADSVSAKMRAGVAILYRMKNVTSKRLRKTVYQSLIESHLRYMLPLYGGTFKTHLINIITLQKKAIRLVIGAPYHAHTEQIFIDLKLLDFFKLYILNILNLLFIDANKFIKPPHAFDTRQQNHSLYQRIIPHHSIPNTTIRKSILPQFVKILNFLPHDFNNYIDNPFVCKKKYVIDRVKTLLINMSRTEVEAIFN